MRAHTEVTRARRSHRITTAGARVCGERDQGGTPGRARAGARLRNTDIRHRLRARRALPGSAPAIIVLLGLAAATWLASETAPATDWLRALGPAITQADTIRRDW